MLLINTIVLQLTKLISTELQRYFLVFIFNLLYTTDQESQIFSTG